MNKKGFTLIELLIVIGIISILAAGVIVAINPGRQFAQARDATRRSHINTLHNGLISYQVDNQGNLTELSLPTEPTEICNTNLSSPTCTDLVDLSTLVDDGYINSIPTDPQGSVSETSDGTGYFIAGDDIVLVADNYETKFVGIGTTESEYAGSGTDFTCGDTLIDSRDSQTYSTVDINGQCWMAANLDIGTRIDGSAAQTDNEIIEKHCYNDNDSNCDIYGGLYQWHEMMEYVTSEGSQGICPSGWHVPTDGEWHSLENYLDENTCSSTRVVLGCDPAGGKLKEAGTTHWLSENCGTATCNSSGFTALPGGMIYNSSFSYIGSVGYWWSSSSEASEDNFWERSIEDTESGVYRWHHNGTNSSFSVRCLKD